MHEESMAKLSSQKAYEYGYLRAKKNKSKKGKSLASILEERDFKQRKARSSFGLQNRRKEEREEKKKKTLAPINTHAK